MIRLEDIFRTLWRRLEDVLETFLQDVLKTSWKGLEDVLKTYGQHEYISFDQDVLKTFSEDVWLRWICSSWARRLDDVFRSRRRKRSSRCLQDVFIKTNVWWVTSNCCFSMPIRLFWPGNFSKQGTCKPSPSVRLTGFLVAVTLHSLYSSSRRK